MPAEWRGVLPALAEDRLDVVDGWTADGDLGVVPGGGRTVGPGHLQRLGVSVVTGVVAPRVAQVDAPDVGDVASGVVAVSDDDELLVVATAGTDPHVQKHMGSGSPEDLAEPPVLLGRERELVRVGAPDQTSHIGAALVGPPEDRGDLAARVPGQ